MATRSTACRSRTSAISKVSFGTSSPLRAPRCASSSALAATPTPSRVLDRAAGLWTMSTRVNRELTMTTRSAVLAAAARLIEKEGVAGLSVREAARRAGVSHNAPYRHFRDRDSLLAGLAEEGAVILERALEGRSGRELGEAYVRFALAHPQRFRLMFRAGARSGMVERFAAAFANVSEARVAGL